MPRLTCHRLIQSWRLGGFLPRSVLHCFAFTEGGTTGAGSTLTSICSADSIRFAITRAFISSREWPQLSFGRIFQDEEGDISGDLASQLGIHRATGISGLYEDRTLLSNSVLGETSWRTLHIEDLSSVISRLHFSIYGPFWNNATDWTAPYSWDQVFDWAGLQNKFTPARKFARAGMYLSDYAELGDTNACLPCREFTEFGDGAIQLSEGNPDTGEGILSEHLSRVEFVEINERFERNTDAEQTHVGSVHLLGVSSANRSDAPRTQRLPGL